MRLCLLAATEGWRGRTVGRGLGFLTVAAEGRSPLGGRGRGLLAVAVGGSRLLLRGLGLGLLAGLRRRLRHELLVVAGWAALGFPRGWVAPSWLGRLGAVVAVLAFAWAVGITGWAVALAARPFVGALAAENVGRNSIHR